MARRRRAGRFGRGVAVPLDEVLRRLARRSGGESGGERDHGARVVRRFVEQSEEHSVSKATEHFSWSEVESKDGAETPAHARGELLRVLRVAEALRLVWGPLLVVSGYRSPAHNRKVGGAPQSQHMAGRALDLAVIGAGGRDARTYELMARHLYEGAGAGAFAEVRYVRWYPRWVHVDVRPAERVLLEGPAGRIASRWL